MKKSSTNQVGFLVSFFPPVVACFCMEKGEKGFGSRGRKCHSEKMLVENFLRAPSITYRRVQKAAEGSTVSSLGGER